MNTHTEEVNLVEIWLRKDSTRWVAGALAGILAGLLSLAFAMVLSSVLGQEMWFPAKVPALPFLGNAATEAGFQVAHIVLGVVVYEVLTTILGILYAHFTGTNSLAPLMGMGLVWGCFSWIFINNLFSHSFMTIRAAQLPSGAVFFVCMVFGLSLTSVSFFDQALRGKK